MDNLTPANGHSTVAEAAAALAVVAGASAQAAAQPYAETWEDRVALVVSKNVPVTPVRPDSKAAFLSDWPTSATTNPTQIKRWSAQYSSPVVFNYAAVATGTPDGVWFWEADSRAVFDRIKAETGRELFDDVKTFLVRSREGRGHVYFRNTPASLAMGNISQGYVKGGDWSARVINQYVVGPGSIHPDSKQPYLALNPDAEILPAPDWFVQWLVSQKVEKKSAKKDEDSIPRNEAGRVPHGSIHSYMVNQCGKMRAMGMDVDQIQSNLLTLVHKHCEPPIDDAKVRQVARSFEKYDEGTPQEQIPELELNQKPDVEGTIEVVPVYDPKAGEAWQKSDMSLAVMNGRLGELCDQRLLKYFPVSYAWTSLISVASVMVPKIVVGPGSYLTEDDSMVNSFTGLVGPVHSGKSQAILWAKKLLGISESNYTDVKAGSSEGLLKKLSKMREAGKLSENVLVDLDEWAHLFAKAGIENSSFTTFMHSAFYKRRQNLVLARGKEAGLDCALSFIGGIVEDEFDTCFGASSMGGLHDRFTFGLCPEGFNFIYRPFEGRPEVFQPVAVHVAPEIWELTESIRKESKVDLGRAVEIAVRAAQVAASFDGINVLSAKYGERMIRAMAAEQAKLREYLRPNAGVTSDAQCANALVSWLNRNAPDGQLVLERDLRWGVRKTLARLGPGAMDYATKTLIRQGVIWYGAVPNLKPWKGRQPHAYRLMDVLGFAGAIYK